LRISLLGTIRSAGEHHTFGRAMRAVRSTEPGTTVLTVAKDIGCPVEDGPIRGRQNGEIGLAVDRIVMNGT